MSIIPWDKVDPDNSPFVRFVCINWYTVCSRNTNFVVLTAAAPSCNSGIFSNSRMLYGLSNQNQAPPTFASTNKHLCAT